MRGTGAITMAAGAAAVSKVAMASLPEPLIRTRPDTQPPYRPALPARCPILRFAAEHRGSMPVQRNQTGTTEVKARKPNGHSAH